MPIDKWLWAVRLFKTRSGGRGGQLWQGEGGWRQCQIGLPAHQGGRSPSARDRSPILTPVKGLIEKRVGAPIAVTMYDDQTPEDELLKTRSEELLPTAFRPGTGRRRRRKAGILTGIGVVSSGYWVVSGSERVEGVGWEGRC